MVEVMIVGADGSEAGERAAAFACARARGRQARLVLVYVVEWSRYEVLTPSEAAERHTRRQQEVETARQRILDPLAQRLDGADVEIESVVRHGHPAEEIAVLAKDLGASQIFIGRHGHSKLGAALFGSVALALAQSAPIPVTIVP